MALSLDALGCEPGDIIKVLAILVGGQSGANRWVSPLVYGESVSPTGGGFANQTFIGARVQLASADQSLPNPAYAGFSEDDVMLQGFYWDVTPEGQWWNILGSLAGTIADAGFTMVWSPPPYKGANVNSSVGYDPFDHYDLGEYSQKGGLARTRYGTKSELLSALSALESNNVTALCDIVPNHMAGGTGAVFKTFNYPHDTFEKTADDFHPTSAGHNHQMFPYHFNFNFGATNDHPMDVAFLSPNMRLGMKKWGAWLVDSIGYKGWRFDYTEGVEPWSVWEWCHYPSQRPFFAFMEYWELSNGREMQEWLDLTGRKAAIYDSHLRELLKEMCEDGDNFDMQELVAPSLLGLEPEYTVVYIDNHDTMRSGDTGKLGIQEDKPLAYSYALHSQGLPMVFWREYFDFAYLDNSANPVWGTKIPAEIDRLIRIRQEAVGGDLMVLHADEDVYVQERSGGAGKYKSILVINDASTAHTNAVQTSWISTELVDLVETNATPDSVTTDSTGGVSITIPGETYRIYSTTNALNEVSNP